MQKEKKYFALKGTKYQDQVPCSYGYRLISVDEQRNKPYKSYFGQDFIYLFIFAMIEESEYYAKILKTIFNKIFNKTIVTLLENVDNLLIADVI